MVYIVSRIYKWWAFEFDFVWYLYSDCNEGELEVESEKSMVVEGHEFFKNI
jgi:hypothetical protein